MRKTFLMITTIFLVNMFFVSGCFSSTPTETEKQAKQSEPQAANQAEKAQNHVAVFDTSMGTFKVELFEDKAPKTTKNFIDLVNKGFYNGLTFHRVIDNFMIQGGDPNGNGTGGPGYTIPDEFHPDLKFNSPGILAMANAGPNTGGSQFFITVKETPWLDRHHAIFGKVVNGFAVVLNISKVSTDGRDKPVKPVIVNKITIE
ncbi:MAG: peptidylprolyl isomerase [Sporomusaceae bacterium]|nr:peptidylprolyl isomerase [Sporomusaceae bacterium]